MSIPRHADPKTYSTNTVLQCPSSVKALEKKNKNTHTQKKKKTGLVLQAQKIFTARLLEEWADMGARLSTLIRLSFGAMDLEACLFFGGVGLGGSDFGWMSMNFVCF